MKKSLRILSMTLISALVMSAGMVAFAAETKETETEGEIEIEIETETEEKTEPETKTETKTETTTTTKTTAAKPKNYTEQKITLRGNNRDVPAILTMPLGSGRFPAVVMLHGTASDKDEAGGGYAHAAPMMAEAGIATIRIDFIGTGDSKVDYSKYNFTTAKSDANLALAYLAQHYRVDETRLGIMGWSQGGTIAMLTAGGNSRIKSVVTWAGAPDLSSLITEDGYEEAQKNGYSIMEFDWRSDLRLGLDWYNDVKKTDVLEEFSKSMAPVLSINGKDDDVVNPRNAQKIVDASYNRYSMTYLIDDCDHTFNVFSGDMTALDKAINATIEYFQKTL